MDIEELSAQEKAGLEKRRLVRKFSPPDNHLDLVNEWLRKEGLPEVVIDLSQPQAMPQEAILGLLTAIPDRVYKQLGRNKEEVLSAEGSLVLQRGRKCTLTPEQLRRLSETYTSVLASPTPSGLSWVNNFLGRNHDALQEHLMANITDLRGPPGLQNINRIEIITPAEREALGIPEDFVAVLVDINQQPVLILTQETHQKKNGLSKQDLIHEVFEYCLSYSANSHEQAVLLGNKFTRNLWPLRNPKKGFGYPVAGGGKVPCATASKLQTSSTRLTSDDLEGAQPVFQGSVEAAHELFTRVGMKAQADNLLAMYERAHKKVSERTGMKYRPEVVVVTGAYYGAAALGDIAIVDIDILGCRAFTMLELEEEFLHICRNINTIRGPPSESEKALQEIVVSDIRAQTFHNTLTVEEQAEYLAYIFVNDIETAGFWKIIIQSYPRSKESDFNQLLQVLQSKYRISSTKILELRSLYSANSAGIS